MATTLPDSISLNGLNVTRSEEGRALRAYQDSVGVWTIGYGLTNFDKGLPWKIEKGLTITTEQAEWYLFKSLRENYVPACKRALMGGTYAKPQGALDGSSDFHYNTGGIEKASFPGALKRGDLAAAKESILSWNKAGGNVLAGLTKRRARNWLEISAEDYGHLTGPVVIEPRADNQERVVGVGELLTAFPRDPQDASAGNVKVDGPPVATTPAPGALRLGSAGPVVTELQNNLNAAGYPTRVTGVYDDQTKASVTAFQKANPNLTADGNTGPATKAALDRAIHLRKVTGVVVKTGGPGLSGLFIAFHNWVSANAGMIVLGIGAAALLTIAVYYGWKYRHEIHAHVNGLIGRTVT